MNESTEFRNWIGRQSVRRDVAAVAPLRSLFALLDRPFDQPAMLPPLGHWLYFLPDAPQSSLGPDGHPRLGGDLPELNLPRRMWAGSRIDFLASIPMGSALERTTTIRSIVRKQGAGGALAFVGLRHEIAVAGQVALIEEQDLVYREPAGSASLARATRDAGLPGTDAIVRIRSCDAAMLFRFSALTFNAHRIHYDRSYAMDVEGYGGLVVQGPLQAMLLIDMFAGAFPDRDVKRFAFRANAPLLDGDEAEYRIEPNCGAFALHIVSPRGERTVCATIEC
jgi:3-methylfumaryl-CoA hydratase